MKFILGLILVLISCISNAKDYVIEFQAKVKNLKEYKITEIKQFRNYDLEGTFTDNYGNYGKFNAIIISDVEDERLIRLDSTGEFIYSNSEKIYLRGIREKSDVDAGIAYNLVMGTTKKLTQLIGTKCTTSVRYFEDAIFGINKCKFSEEQNKILNNLK